MVLVNCNHLIYECMVGIIVELGCVISDYAVILVRTLLQGRV